MSKLDDSSGALSAAAVADPPFDGKVLLCDVVQGKILVNTTEEER